MRNCVGRSRRAGRPAVFAALAASLALAPGCASAVRVGELSERGAVEVRLDSNAEKYIPGKRLVFYVDLFNRTGRAIDLADLKVELRVLDEAGTVLLRQDWTYRWEGEMLLLPGKRVTLPVVPRKGLELPVQFLPPATYEVVAVVCGRYESRPYRLEVLRPDLAS